MNPKDKDKISCFIAPVYQVRPLISSQLRKWFTQFPNCSYSLSQNEEEALSRLIPLLLCGEQSAQMVFHNEIQRIGLDAHSKSTYLLKQIESDEYGHDMALKHMLNYLPKSEDQKKILRRSQVFFASLGRADSIANHFIQISKLDSLVAKLLNAIIHSNLKKDHPFSILCNIIKSDEAKHVSISYNHAKNLGAKKHDFEIEQEKVISKLMKFLEYESHSFESLGIDTKKLFTKLEINNESTIF